MLEYIQSIINGDADESDPTDRRATTSSAPAYAYDACVPETPQEADILRRATATGFGV